MKMLFCKLRANITLDGDVALAERELRSCFVTVQPIKEGESLLLNNAGLPTERLLKNMRSCGGVIGFLCSTHLVDLHNLVTTLSFIQEIWLHSEKPMFSDKELPQWAIEFRENDGYLVCALPLMAAGEFLGALKKKIVNSGDLFQILTYLALEENDNDGLSKDAVSRKMTSTPHVHGLHKYKAKFFPRMIRSFLVPLLGTLPRNSTGEVVVLDPFVGSGTTLAEASLLGLSSIGIDIDQLSCAISRAKLFSLSQLSVKKLDELIASVVSLDDPLFRNQENLTNYKFPPWIAKKFERWGTNDEKQLYEDEISRWIDVIEKVKDPIYREPLQICLSDAISRKFNIRMMGTGVGRFALEIGQAKLSHIIKSNLISLLKTISACKVLCEVYDISLPEAKVVCDTATKMPLPSDSISVVLTSPPYLPAASGREDYLIGKSISISALGYMTNEELQEADKKSVGSMKNISSHLLDDLPESVAELYNWLKHDELREIKAVPTAVYYKNLREALQETLRVLLPDGFAIYVIGKESVFYKFSTREVLYRVKCDDIFQEIAQDIGFEIVDKLDVELDKKNRNARPRSLDSYYETVFFLRKPPLRIKKSCNVKSRLRVSLPLSQEIAGV